MQKSNTETLPLTICVCICMRLQFQFVCKCLRIVLHKLYYWKCSLKVCVTCKDLCYFYLLSLVCSLLHVWKMSSYPQFPKLWITNLKKERPKIISEIICECYIQIAFKCIKWTSNISPNFSMCNKRTQATLNILKYFK